MTNDNQPNSPGRPPELDDAKRLNIYLDSRSQEIATRLGNGNLSLGIRLALDASEPVTTASIIERIRSQHIHLAANWFLADLDTAIKGLTAGKQGAVLKSLELDYTNLIQELRQRDSFESAASQWFDLYAIGYNQYVVTSEEEVNKNLAMIGGKLVYDGAYHIETSEHETYSGAEFEDALEKWIGNSESSEKFYLVRDTPEEAWQDACTRNSIPPAVLQPAHFFIVSDALADELEKRKEIVSKKLMGGYRIWGCLHELNSVSDFANVQVLKKIVQSPETRNKLLKSLKRY